MRITSTLLLVALAGQTFGAEIGVPDRRDIQGGSEATVYDYPSVVLLVGLSTPPRSCSGTLITDEWVLTAAHCVDGFKAGEYSFDSDLAISHGYPLYAELRHAMEIRMHPDFDPLEPFADWAHDIALVRLNEPFLSRTAASVTLAESADGMFLLQGTMTTAVAWGGENATTMTQAEWPLVACPEDPSAHLCTTGNATLGLEQGDSGGPLLTQQDEEWVQIGIHSSVTAPEGLQRHVRVDGHREWIGGELEGTVQSDPDPCVDDGIQTPPPAPQPFQPQPVEVALGEAGGNITLMTTEAGGFTLNGEAFESGGSVTAENGNSYLLVLADGSWTAAFQAVEIMVTLGITEEMVTLVRAEDGTYWIGDAAVQSGVTTVSAENGNTYTLMITTDDAGMITWMATYVEPVVNVMLGLSGDTVMIRRSEDGSYWLGDMTVESGRTTVTAYNGTAYRLKLTTDMSGRLVWIAEALDP